MSNQVIAGIARASLLVDMNIRVYSGRKQDKRTQAEVTSSKGAKSSRAASVYKSLFADCKELDDITKFQARMRAEHYRLTKPWNDTGTRQLPTMLLQKYSDTMDEQITEFKRLVQVFLAKYDTLVAAAAFQLGTLFDREEYPSREIVERRFSVDINMYPLPTSGDFRLDIEAEVQQELIDKYERQMAQQIERANRDSWQRLYDVVSRMSDRLTVEEDGTKRKFHDTLVSNAQELCELLTALNVTQDPTLESARCQLEKAIFGVTPKELREEDGTRALVKKQVDDILSNFDWSLDE